MQTIPDKSHEGVVSTFSNDDERHQYFNACCQDGLLECIKTITVSDPHVVQKAFFNALVKRPKNVVQILEYLWDTYPNTPWHTQPMLHRLVCVSAKLSHKMLAHIQQHDSQRLECSIGNIAFGALKEKNTATIKVLLPYINNNDLKNLIVVACRNKDLPFVKMFISAYPPDLYTALFKALPKKNRPMVEEIFSEMQAIRLNKDLSKHLDSPVNKQFAKRKM